MLSGSGLGCFVEWLWLQSKGVAAGITGLAMGLGGWGPSG